MMSQSSCSHTVSQEAPAPADLSVGVRGLTGWPGSCQVCPVFPLAQALSGRPCACAQPPAPRGVQGASQVPLRPTLIPALAGKFIQCHNWLCCVLLCFLVFFFFWGGSNLSTSLLHNRSSVSDNGLWRLARARSESQPHPVKSWQQESLVGLPGESE